MADLPMHLGNLIEALQQQEQNALCQFDFGGWPDGIASYRGHYDHLAIGVAVGKSSGTQQMPKVAEVVAMISKAVGQTFPGWKGGESKMHEHTPVWVANPGEDTGTGVVGVRGENDFVYIETAHIDAGVA